MPTNVTTNVTTNVPTNVPTSELATRSGEPHDLGGWAGGTLAPMPFPRRLLNDYEEVALDLHPHWMFFAEPGLTLIGALAVLIGIVAKTDNEFLRLFGLVLVVLAAGWLGIRYLTWATTNFVITTDRLIFRHGIFAKRGIEMPLERVNNVNFHQSFFERLVGAGNLLIESGGEDGQQRFTDIRKPEIVQKMIHAQIEGNENRKYDRISRNAQAGATLPPPAPTGKDPVAQLKELAELRDKGVITAAEFEAQKAKLLERM